MKSHLVFKTLLIASLTAGLFSARADTTNLHDAIELVRASYQMDRQAFLTSTLDLSEKESAAFWPLYHSYRADVDKIGDELVKLVLEYADLYPDVPEDRAARLLKQYTSLEKRMLDKRTWYFKRAGKVLPATKVLRWAQLENRMDLVLRLQLAGGIPIISGEKKHP